MITHIILLKLNDASQESIDVMKARLLGMKGQIECLQDLAVGVDFAHAPVSYDMAMVAHFASREDLNAYIAHPAHVEVGKYIEKVQAQVAAIDYEE